jgi:hypothetical protein
MKKYLAATPGLSKAAWLLAIVTAAYLASWVLAAMILGSQNTAGSAPWPMLAVGGVFALAFACAPLAVIAMLLRIESAAAKRIGAVLAAGAAVSGIMLMLAPLLSIGPIESGGPGLLFWISWGVLGVAYAPVAYLGLRDASRLARHDPQRQALA